MTDEQREIFDSELSKFCKEIVKETPLKQINICIMWIFDKLEETSFNKIYRCIIWLLDKKEEIIFKIKYRSRL